MRINSRKGSFTIEAAVLSGVFLFIFLGLFQLFFFVHNRAWLSCAAYEAAVTGSMAGELSGQDPEWSAFAKADYLKNSGLYGLEDLDLSVHISALGNVEVKYAYKVPVIWQENRFAVHTSGNSRILRPVLWIRQVKAAGGVIMRAG